MHMRIWTIVILCALAAGTLHAQEDATLSPGFSVQGSLSTDEPAQYSLVLREGAMISAQVIGSSGLDPILAIIDPNGTPLLVQDDYSYPEVTDARILAFTAPRTGTYTIEVRRYGQTSGEYELEINPGYLVVAYENRLDTAQGWRVNTDDTSSTPPTITAEQGNLRVSLEGVNRLISVTNSQLPQQSDFYVSLDVNSIEGRNGWQVGMQIRANDNGSYVYVVDQRGFWRFSVIQNGSARVIRDWTAHPAIQAGVTSFKIGILASGRDFDFFHNSQYIGTVTDDTIADPGEIRPVLGTSNAIGSRASAAIANLIVTVPDTNPVTPAQLIGGSSSVTMRELKRHRIVPSGGEVRLTLSEASVSAFNAGVARFALGRGATFTDFVLSVTLTRSSSSGTSACGMIVRDQAETNSYILAYGDSSTGYGLSQRAGDTFISAYYNDQITLNNPYTLLIIAVGERVVMYLNGHYAGEISTDAIAGGIGQSIVNFEPLDTSCQLRDLWLWAWN